MATANGSAHTPGSTGKDAARVSELDGSAPESTDYANYFCTYAFLYHQVRTGWQCSLHLCTAAQRQL